MDVPAAQDLTDTGSELQRAAARVAKLGFEGIRAYLRIGWSPMRGRWRR
jgi:hypothetical protein